jgi:hypothetical protein
MQYRKMRRKHAYQLLLPGNLIKRGDREQITMLQLSFRPLRIKSPMGCDILS